MRRYYVYIMSNRKRTLYVGITADLELRVLQHKKKLIRGFTRKYDITRLVWFEDFYTAPEAISAEKKIKGWLRSKKIALIESINPNWDDLAADLSVKPQIHSEQCPRHSERSEESSPPPDPSLRSG